MAATSQALTCITNMVLTIPARPTYQGCDPTLQQHRRLPCPAFLHNPVLPHTQDTGCIQFSQSHPDLFPPGREIGKVSDRKEGV